MNYYFFPQIKGFNSSVTLVNYPPLDNFSLIKKKQKIYVAWSTNDFWNYKQIGEISPYEAIEIKRSEIDIDKKFSPFIFFYFKELPKYSKELILSNHMYNKPTWRGNIKIYSPYTATSYEGDYQHEMVKFVKKGSLVSISPMIQNSKSLKTKFIFVNISLKPEIKKHKIYFYDPMNNKILKKSYIHSNTCNVADIENIKTNQNSPTMTISKTISGIPIYFSYSSDKKALSIEHTHPPSSFTVFGDTLFFQRKLKSYWLKKV